MKTAFNDVPLDTFYTGWLHRAWFLDRTTGEPVQVVDRSRSERTRTGYNNEVIALPATWGVGEKPLSVDNLIPQLPPLGYRVLGGGRGPCYLGYSFGTSYKKGIDPRRIVGVRHIGRTGELLWGRRVVGSSIGQALNRDAMTSLFYPKHTGILQIVPEGRLGWWSLSNNFALIANRESYRVRQTWDQPYILFYRGKFVGCIDYDLSLHIPERLRALEQIISKEIKHVSLLWTQQ